jgi:predicted RNA binding protein YcfA (HicA-like mRNA interferase family)
MGFTMTMAEMIKFLEANGFIQESGGRHQIIMVKGNMRVPVPSHSGDVPKGTVNHILSQAGFRGSDAKKWKEKG